MTSYWNRAIAVIAIPFLNCTNCGPRLSIVTGAPYDRDKTTMAQFAMCPQCRAEYEDPTNRRFHAQPTACAACGPSLTALDSNGQPIDAVDPLAHFVAAIRSGKIGALKGLGGYHLVCDARNSQAVAELRRRKHRDEKPLAIMVGDMAEAESLCEIDSDGENFSVPSAPSPVESCRDKTTPPARATAAPNNPRLSAERNLLRSSARPIVLLRKRPDSCELAENIAGENPFIGIMLPYTPLHHLLLHDMDGNPLVMTSGNRSDEPIAYEDADAVERLGGIADVFLTHNRPIHVRCDDSVTRVIRGHESPVAGRVVMRRSRFRCRWIARRRFLPSEGNSRRLSRWPAIGGRSSASIWAISIISRLLLHLKETLRSMTRLFSLQPKCIAHDMHPDYASSRYARRREAEEGIQCIAVQHHHAHMAACMAEHGLNEPVIGVTFDGTGFGTDGKIWGGEFLVGDYRGFKRAAHLRYVGMPGGESRRPRAVADGRRPFARRRCQLRCP